MRKLEALLEIEETEYHQAVEEEEFKLPTEKTKDELFAETKEIYRSLSTSEKIDMSLTSVTGISDHDKEMDVIAHKAMETFTSLVSLGDNAPVKDSGKIYEVASTMLKTALDAKDSKVSTKLRLLELQIRKLRMDREHGDGDDDTGERTVTLDRNELMKILKG